MNFFFIFFISGIKIEADPKFRGLYYILSFLFWVSWNCFVIEKK
jgi:hypothetical protein